MAQYGRLEYWDQRYLATTKDGPFEWYQGYGSLRHLFNPVQFSIQSTATTMKPRDGSFPHNAPMSPFPPQHECRVLVLGCGNSTFSEEMYRDGWTGRMVSVDWSSVVINQMQDKYNESYYEKLWNERAAEAPKMEFLCTDITQKLPFEDESFDLIVCKGSFDAVLCSSSPITSIRRVVAECVRLLARGHGVFFLVTTGTPDNRTLYLEHQNELDYYWQGVGVHAVPRPGTSVTPGTDHVYICRKRLNEAKQRAASPNENVGAETKTSQALATGTSNQTGSSVKGTDA